MTKNILTSKHFQMEYGLMVFRDLRISLIMSFALMVLCFFSLFMELQENLLGVIVTCIFVYSICMFAFTIVVMFVNFLSAISIIKTMLGAELYSANWWSDHSRFLEDNGIMYECYNPVDLLLSTPTYMRQVYVELYKNIILDIKTTHILNRMHDNNCMVLTIETPYGKTERIFLKSLILRNEVGIYND